MDDRVAILEAAIDAVCRHAYAGIGTYFDQAEFERSVPADWAQRYGSIYSQACQLCLQATGHWLGQWQCPMKVEYLFESGHKHWKEADARLTAVVALQGIAKTLRYRRHAFVKKAEPGLQTANLFVWTMTRVHAHQAGKEVYPAFVPTLMKLARAPMQQKLHKVTGNKLKRLLEEHATRPHDLFVDFKHAGTLKQPREALSPSAADVHRARDKHGKRAASCGRERTCVDNGRDPHSSSALTPSSSDASRRRKCARSGYCAFAARSIAAIAAVAVAGASKGDTSSVR